jgi:OFA family oxalate/formate antiporter-like MFS transporter
MYGGGFATLPAFLGDLFGTKQLGAIHGMVLAGWALAGVIGPTIYDVVKKTTGSLDITLKGIFRFVFSCFCSFLTDEALSEFSLQEDKGNSSECINNF